ncbi:helix-turn-helix transcriptional regulator [Hymenobacter terrestris]|uniref:WYL domain-containing protein n=1 Tax=Hymenobacter terrestris TaxID=2748310 RepID=A0ABX2Q0M1_9BACT|nr:WYL domain-containing protein [Hymenobacter terrestris]NVO84490.1 WYL domain-containing protein [Hymenobacter terrestris]
MPAPIQPFPESTSDNNAIPQQKLLALLRLVRLLKEPGGRTMAQLLSELDKKQRTMQRYLRLLEEVGYPVDKTTTQPARYFLFEPAPEGRGIRHEPLNDQETELLSLRLADLGTPNPVLAGLRQKLQLPALLLPQPHELRSLRQARILETLALGIELRRQVRLLAYESGNTGTVRDRDVEPLALANNHTQLASNDVATGQYRTYNLNRMGGAELLDATCTLPDSDRRPDVFGMAETDEWTTVELLLTSRSYQQLLRESATAAAECQPATATEQAEGWAHRYRDRVHGFHGVGRFVLGLPLEVRVAAPESLRQFVLDKVAGAKW